MVREQIKYKVLRVTIFFGNQYVIHNLMTETVVWKSHFKDLYNYKKLFNVSQTGNFKNMSLSTSQEIFAYFTFTSSMYEEEESREFRSDERWAHSSMTVIFGVTGQKKCYQGEIILAFKREWLLPVGNAM